MKLQTINLFVILLGATLLNSTAHGAIKVITTIPDLAWAVQQVGKEHLEVKSLLKGTENPHYADAVPEFIRLVANADVVCLVGLELEVGWLPKVLERSGNAQVQVGGKGYCDMSKGIQPLEKPTGAVDRSMGDVHPFGNPHYWLSPRALAQAADVAVTVLSEVDPGHASDFQKNHQDLVRRLDKLVAENKAKLKASLAGYGGPVFIEYHKEFSYFSEHYELKSFGSIEEKPGVPPNAGQLATVATRAKAAGVKVTLSADFNPTKTLERFREISAIPLLTVPVMIRPSGEHKDYIQLQSHIVDSLVRVLK